MVTRIRKPATPALTIPFRVDIDVVITPARYENLVMSLFSNNWQNHRIERRKSSWPALSDTEYEDLQVMADSFATVSTLVYRALSSERKLDLVRFLIFTPRKNEGIEETARTIAEFLEFNELYFGDLSKEDQAELVPFLREFIAAARTEIDKIRSYETNAEAKRAKLVENGQREMISALQEAGFTVTRPRSPAPKKAKA